MVTLLADRISSELFGRLDGPVNRIGALDAWEGYHPQLEAAILAADWRPGGGDRKAHGLLGAEGLQRALSLEGGKPQSPAFKLSSGQNQQQRQRPSGFRHASRSGHSESGLTGSA